MSSTIQGRIPVFPTTALTSMWSCGKTAIKDRKEKIYFKNISELEVSMFFLIIVQ